MLSLPRSLVVCGHKVTIKAVDRIGEGVYGLFDSNTHTITIATSYSEENQLKTLLHESMHAVLHYSGASQVFGENDVLEEVVVHALENGLWGLRTQLGRLWTPKA